MDFDEPLSFVLGEGGVIDGWERGLVGTCPGEKLELTIPPELGYGEEGNLESINTVRVLQGHPRLWALRHFQA